MNDIPDRLQEIVEDFSFCVGQEKLEYLLEFAEKLQPLPEWLHEKRETLEQVHECMTPVFVYAEHENGRLHFHFDIPPEAPTVRGFAALLQDGLDGTTPAEVTAVPNEFYLQMGLQSVLSGQRLNGIAAILAHMKTLAQTT
ncbi:MAG: SufE family protein [Chloroflexi bacterium]|nr:SufE family protein [Chloroflexota bacterium]MBP7044493.1 SufE family protein [Chloroflexota bacterium]